MRTAVVVGAGVGGLAAAGALTRSGWQVTLIERGDRLSGNGAAMLIWPNGAAALDALGVSLGDIAFPMLTRGVRRFDGRWLIDPEAAPPVEEHLRPVVVHADDLHDALMAALGDATDIRTGVEITMVRTGSLPQPAVGTGRHTFEADLIVAADGSQSIIRQRLMPRSVVVSVGFTAWRAVIPWYRAPKLAEGVPTAGELLGTGQRFVYAALGERGSSGGTTRGGLYWVATAAGAPRPEPAATQLGLLRRWFADWQPPVGDLLEATEPGDLVQQPGEELRPLPQRFGIAVGTGGIALLGDAAHVCSPNLTQGACLAFEDAATLRSVMRDRVPAGTIALSLDEYTSARWARVARVAATSRRLGRVLQAQGRLAVRLRDAALGRFPTRLMETATAIAADWAPPN